MPSVCPHVQQFFSHSVTKLEPDLWGFRYRPSDYFGKNLPFSVPEKEYSRQNSLIPVGSASSLFVVEKEKNWGAVQAAFATWHICPDAF